MHSRLKRFLNYKGFSLVEVLVSSGILTILVLAIFSITDAMLKFNQQNSLAATAFKIESELRNLMSTRSALYSSIQYDPQPGVLTGNALLFNCLDIATGCPSSESFNNPSATKDTRYPVRISLLSKADLEHGTAPAPDVHPKFDSVKNNGFINDDGISCDPAIDSHKCHWQVIIEFTPIQHFSKIPGSCANCYVATSIILKAKLEHKPPANSSVLALKSKEIVIAHSAEAFRTPAKFNIDCGPNSKTLGFNLVTGKPNCACSNFCFDANNNPKPCVKISEDAYTGKVICE